MEFRHRTAHRIKGTSGSISLKSDERRKSAERRKKQGISTRDYASISPPVNEKGTFHHLTLGRKVSNPLNPTPDHPHLDFHHHHL